MDLLRDLKLDECYIELVGEIRGYNIESLFGVVESCTEGGDAAIVSGAEIPCAAEARENPGVVLSVLGQCCFVLCGVSKLSTTNI